MDFTFVTKFGKYVCGGDSIQTNLDHRGVYYKARVEYDNDMHRPPDQRQDGFWPSRDPNAAGYVLPEHFDTEKAKAERIMAAWENDEWFYCGIIVSAHIDLMGEQFCLSKHAASLWGIECNYPDSDNDYLNEVAEELLGEAESAAEQVISNLLTKISTVAEQES